jgi:methylthioribose-1-phosphate isomerase
MTRAVLVGGRHYRTLWVASDGWSLEVIDQRRLPHELAVARLSTVEEVERAIRDMWVRGAPLIGAAAAYGMCLAVRADPSDAAIERARARLLATRPTAINLRWALDEIGRAIAAAPPSERAAAAYARAAALCDAEADACRAIGQHGLPLIKRRTGMYRASRGVRGHRRSAAAKRRAPDRPPGLIDRADRGRPDAIQVMTHCNAGWLATVDWGTALAPVYAAHDAGLPVHVWVSETRPRNQGAALTAWELLGHGVPHTVVADSACGHLMQRGQVDLCIVGSDRTTASGDVCNKIGTYLKALAARASGVPFCVALPGSTIDWSVDDGLRDIPIEERDASEVAELAGVRIAPSGSAAHNPAFDVTPAQLVTHIITERGICAASRDGLRGLYPDAPR